MTRRLLVMLSLLACTVGLAAPAVANPGADSPDKSGRAARHSRPKQVDKVVHSLDESLGLSAGQKKRVRPIVWRAYERIVAVHAKLHDHPKARAAAVHRVVDSACDAIEDLLNFGQKLKFKLVRQKVNERVARAFL